MSPDSRDESGSPHSPFYLSRPVPIPTDVKENTVRVRVHGSLIGHPPVVRGSSYGYVPRPFGETGVQEKYPSTSSDLRIKSYHTRGLRTSRRTDV